MGIPDNPEVLAAERFKLWASALDGIVERGEAGKLLEVLRSGSRADLEAFLEPTRLFGAGVCIDIVTVFEKLVNFGPGHYEERCEVVHRILPLHPSSTNGKIYRLSDGSYVFVSDRDWANYAQEAAADPAWAEQNKQFLKDIGVLTCSWEWVPDSRLISFSIPKRICFSSSALP